MNNIIKDKIDKEIENSIDAMINLQRELTKRVAIGPDNGGEGEYEKALFLDKYLKNLGINKIKWFNAPDKRAKNEIRPNIVAMVPGENKEKTIWILSHLDIVPTGDLKKWNNPPFDIIVKDGKIYGRGVEDDQQGIVTSIFAIKTLLNLKLKPKYNVGLVFVSDEETGSKYGLTYLLQNHKDIFKKEDIIIVPDGGSEDGLAIEIAEKSIVWFKFIIKGKQAHASMPERGINAHKAGANLIVNLEKLYKTFNYKDKLFEPPISTFEPTKKEANVDNINTIPPEDIFYLDCRVLPKYKLQEIEDEINKIKNEIEKNFKVTIEIEKIQYNQAPPATKSDSEVVKLLASAIEKVYNKKAKLIGIGGGTVAAIFREYGYQAAVWSTLDEMAHQINEYCKIENLINDTKVFTYLMLGE